MSRIERERARRISEYVDGLVVHRREEDPRPTTPDEEFRELARLARTLSAIELPPPPAFREQLADGLLARSEGAVDADAAASRLPWFVRASHLRSAARSWWPQVVVVRTAAVVAVVVAALVVFAPYLAAPPTVSAAAILTRADTALSKLVRPGQILYRRWRVVDRISGGGDAPVVRESVIHEWMDGADFGRVASRNERDGRTYLGYVTTRENGELRPRVYFAPGFSGEPRGLLSIEPSRRDFQAALGAFETGDRAKLQTYLDRGYIFEPISGERRFNRLALETSTEDHAPLPRVMLSLNEEMLSGGVPVYAVRIFDPARVRFRWKSAGPPTVWLEQRETVRYIARDTDLSLRSEERFTTEDGRQVFATRELLETRIVERGATLADPFTLTVPEGTPVRQQSAREQLTAVAGVLRTLPARLLTTDR